jgi:CRISPR/Cas system-associated exonuclease Cas4 (RecB family)
VTAEALDSVQEPTRAPLSASAVPRLLSCPASAVLPQREYNTAHSAAGSARHADREAAADVRDLTRLPDEVASMIRSSDRLIVEQVFAYDVATGEARRIGPVPREQYHTIERGPFELLGKPDLVIIGAAGAIVVDYKGFEPVAPAESNAQLATYALMVARTYEVDAVDAAIVYEIRRPSIATLEAMDLDAHAERLRQLHGDVARAVREPGRYLATGPHCKYCPAFDACPRQQALRVDVETGLVSMRVEQSIPFADDEEAQWALDLLAELKLIEARLHAALAARAKERPIPLRNGKMWGERDVLGKEKLVADVVHAVMTEKYGPKIAEIAAPRVATKKAIKEALGFVGADSVAEAERELLAAIKASGGTKQDRKTEVGEYEPGPRLIEAPSR